MAHQRKRFLTELISKAQRLSPLIGVLGHRQVGKTTLLESICKQYSTLDDIVLLNESLRNPAAFIKSLKPPLYGIDECQLSPPLFPALKEHVRKNKSPGQFLLSGSVRFTSRRAIQESLTGRIVNFELLPFSISEIAHQELPQTAITLMKATQIERAADSITSRTSVAKKLVKEFEYYKTRGGLPGICFINDEKLRQLRIKEQINTILDRDARMVSPTTVPYTQMLDLLKYTASTQGTQFNYSQAKRVSGLSTSTIKKLMYAFESVFLIRRIPIEGEFAGETFYLEDQAESNFLSENQFDEHDNFTQLIYRNLRIQFYYKMGATYRESFFKTRGQIQIPYAIEFEGSHLGILPITGDIPDRAESAIASVFLKRYEKGRVLYLNKGKSLNIKDDRSLIAPAFYFI